jgi:hypothetical protein
MTLETQNDTHGTAPVSSQTGQHHTGRLVRNVTNGSRKSRLREAVGIEETTFAPGIGPNSTVCVLSRRVIPHQSSAASVFDRSRSRFIKSVDTSQASGRGRR